jgi:hypothetical protein
MAPILAQAKMETANSGSLVNKYKLDLLWLCLFPQNICHFANPLMQFVIGNMQASSEGSLGSNIMAVLSPLC